MANIQQAFYLKKIYCKLNAFHKVIIGGLIMKEITSSMAGTVLNILVGSGDEVSAGQEVLMLESMKMEIPVESQTTGKVSEVRVNIGDFVNEGDVLLVLE